MKKPIPYSVWSLCLCLISFIGYAQDIPYLAQQLDNRHGLSSSAVNCIFQDADDMVWVGTWDGLNRYDGQAFHVFNYNNYNQSDPKRAGSNVIQNIVEDRHGNMWVSTMEGILRYTKERDGFDHYFFAPERNYRVREQEFEVVVDAGGAVYARAPGAGIVWFDEGKNNFQNCHLPDEQHGFGIKKLSFDTANRLWVLSVDGKLRVYEVLADHQLKELSLDGMEEPIRQLFAVDGKIFLSTASVRLLEVDVRTLKQVQVAQLTSNPRAMVYHDDHYYLAMEGLGYEVYDRYFRPDAAQSSEMDRLRDMKITGWISGKENLLWAATDGNGLIKIIPKKSPFAYLSPLTGGSTKPVRAIREVDGALWIGTKGGGIASVKNFDPKQDTLFRWDYFTANAELPNNSVYAIVHGADSLVYVGTDGKGLTVYDRESKRFVKWSEISGNQGCPEFGSVYAVTEDRDGSTWVGTSGYGLIHLRFSRLESGKIGVQFIEQYTYTDDETGLANDIIYAVSQGSDNLVWVACRYGGLSLLDKESGKVTTFKAFTREGSLSNNDVLTLYIDSKKRCWIGTSYGLNWIHEDDILLDNPIFHHMTTADGLPNNTIHAIIEDDMGYIWVSTNKGLAKINPTDFGIAYYQDNDGLQGNEFSDGAIWKDGSGYLYVGGTRGLNNFLPQHVTENVYQPHLQLGGLHFASMSSPGNRYFVLKADQPAPKQYALERNGNFFSLDLSALSFLHAEKCEYAWQLVGHDKDWQYGGTSGKVVYSNIPPGKYVFLVKWTNGEGLWTAPQEAFSLRVKPYVWLTWPALLCYAVLLAVGGYFLYTDRRNKLEIRHQLSLEQKLREKDEALHEEQLNFFTNITHELQTPLTLIMGSAERFQYHEKQVAEPKSRKNLLAILYQQASRLTYLVQQLLEFRKMDAGHLKNHYAVIDVSVLLSQLTDLFVPLSEQLNMTYERHIPDGIVIAVDKDKLEKIIYNMLSNAFKHSGKREHVIVDVEWTAATQRLKTTVSNSGCTIDETELEKLFGKFHTGATRNPSTFATGIGLPFIRKLAHLMQGEIQASVDGDWVSFSAVLPVPEGFGNDEEDVVYASDPSYIYRKMTAVNAADSFVSTDEQNKKAILEELVSEAKKAILIVEDEPAIRYLLRDILSGEYVVYEAFNGLEAIDLIRRNMPDLIISDVMMPGMDGLALCDKIKNTPSTCHIPFIMLSARGTIEQRTEGYELGADAYIAKPFHSKHLKARVRNLLDQQGRFHQFFVQSGDQQLTAVGDQEHHRFLTSLVEIVENHLDDPALNPELLEQKLAMSKMQLYRKLKTMGNMTPTEFIRYIRLRNAAKLLSTTQLTVAEIFYQTGFNNQSYFFREFKKMYHCAPNEYRAQYLVKI